MGEVILSNTKMEVGLNKFYSLRAFASEFYKLKISKKKPEFFPTCFHTSWAFMLRKYTSRLNKFDSRLTLLSKSTMILLH